jgi:hypothetical protein
LIPNSFLLLDNSPVNFFKAETQIIFFHFKTSIGRFVVIQPSIYEYSQISLGLNIHGRLKLALTASATLHEVNTSLFQVSTQVATICNFIDNSSILISQKILSNSF